MLIRPGGYIKSSEITDKGLYINRRRFLASTGLGVAGLIAPSLLYSSDAPAAEGNPSSSKSIFSTDEKPTPYKDATGYNNFYEFSTAKEGLAKLSRKFKTRPWTVSVEGEVKKARVYDIDRLTKAFPPQERVYRMRCVEGWSMVIPWLGLPLGNLIRSCDPSPGAKFVEFTTLHDPDQMPGQRRSVLEWPYIEGLRLDEALHPLTILAVGMYGEELPNQNGAPLRLVVPWKYGFKSIKSIVRIRLVKEMPLTSWVKANAGEYGFYANVNPDVDHPRWSQARERRIGEFRKRETLMFNGYAQQVENLYSGMDLRKFF